MLASTWWRAYHTQPKPTYTSPDPNDLLSQSNYTEEIIEMIEGESDCESWNIINDELEVGGEYRSVHGALAHKSSSPDVWSIEEECASYDEYIYLSSDSESEPAYKQEISQLFADSVACSSSPSPDRYPPKALPEVITRVLESPLSRENALIPEIVKPVDQLPAAGIHTSPGSNVPIPSSVTLLRSNRDHNNATCVSQTISESVQNAYNTVNHYIFEAYKQQVKTQSATNMLNRLSEELENRSESIDIEELRKKCQAFTGLVSAASIWAFDEARNYVKQLPVEDWIRNAVQAKDMLLNEASFTNINNENSNGEGKIENRMISHFLIPVLREKGLPLFDGTDFQSWFDKAHLDFERILLPHPAHYLDAIKLFSQPEVRSKLERVIISSDITCDQMILKLHSYFEGEELYDSEPGSIIHM